MHIYIDKFSVSFMILIVNSKQSEQFDICK